MFKKQTRAQTDLFWGNKKYQELYADGSAETEVLYHEVPNWER